MPKYLPVILLLLLFYSIGVMAIAITNSNTTDSLLKIGNSIYRRSPDSAHSTAQRLKAEAREQNDTYFLGESYFLDGKTYRRVEKNYDDALVQYYNALQYFRKIGHTKGMAKTLREIGLCHYDSYNYRYALDYYMNELPYRLKLNNPRLDAETYNNIGLALYRLNSYDSAIIYFERSIALKESLNLYVELMNSYISIGTCYHKQKNYEAADKFYKQSLQLAKEHNNPYFESLSISDIGVIYYAQGNIEKAENYFRKAISYKEFFTDKSKLIQTYRNLGELYFERKDYTMAIEYYQMGVNLNPEETDKIALIEAYEELISHYEKLGNYKKEISRLQSDLLKVTVPIAKKFNWYEKQHKSYLATKIKDDFEKNQLKQANIAYLKDVHWLGIAAVILLTCVIIVSYFVHIYRKRKISQRALIVDLMEKDFVLHHLRTYHNFDVRVIVDEIKRMRHIELKSFPLPKY